MEHHQQIKLWASMLAIILMILSCAKEKEAPEILRPVRYQKVFSTGGERTRTFSGVAQAGLESRLSFKVPGTIQKLYAKVGDKVTVGQLIAELDPTDYELQVQQAQASLESAKAQERNAEANYNRVRQLWENRNASRNDLDASRAAYESASAQVRAQEKQLELAQTQLSYTKLKAPVNGSIATLDVEVNENVDAGKTVVQFSSRTNMEVLVTIPEILISRVREGENVNVTFDALPGNTFTAHVTEVGVASTGFATTYPVKVRLEEAGEDIRPGMAAEVAFRFGGDSGRERMVIPSVGVGEDRSGRFVFVVEPSEEAGVGIVHRKPVVIGDLVEEGIEVFEGLADGDRVITAGVSRLTDGQRVKFESESQSR